MRFVVHFYRNPSADFFKRQLDDYFHGSPFLAYKAKHGNDPRVIVYTKRDDQMFLGPIETSFCRDAIRRSQANNEQL